MNLTRRASASIITYPVVSVLLHSFTLLFFLSFRSWLATAVQQPVVVNRTLAPLSNLFYAYPRVQAHLRRTIDYYLTKGSLPTFAQLQS